MKVDLSEQFLFCCSLSLSQLCMLAVKHAIFGGLEVDVRHLL